MGGGDLNLKKSWHPQTLKNVERVWKAEQKHEAEKKKIEELQRELREERAREEMQRFAEDSGALKKKSDRLDWMYQGPCSMVNKEEYLLGRPIDKYATDKMVDEEAGPSSDTGLLPGSIFSATGANSALDMASKIREDPLFMIRKREEEKKREVLTNPMKMKMIREILQKNLDKRERKKKKDKKKHKKHRRSSGHEQHKAKYSDKGNGQAHNSSPLRGGYPTRPRSHQSSKLSADELERRRVEMMENAKWNDKTRQTHIRRYKEEEEMERELERKDTGEGKFLHKMKLQSTATSSLEDRVKRNIHSIQRTPAALEKNFMRK
uniref:pre-mRNA-splicing factor CWC25 homolog isoform X2 n=1 Tax=Pristiophorus japonicus TaxID=55135 RepID=UPI00398F1B75